MKGRNHAEGSEFKPASGEIWVNSFTEASARQFREQVLMEAREDPNKPIIIYIDSYGGFADSLAAMLETMDEVQNPFVTVAYGKAMSCGAILLSHGDYRYVGKYARVMVHEVTAGSWGNARTLKNDTKEILRLNRVMMELVAKNCGMKGYDDLKNKFREHDADEIWMSAQDAVAFGIADYVGSVTLVPMIAWNCCTPPNKVRRKAAKDSKPAKVSKPKKK